MISFPVLLLRVPLSLLQPLLLGSTSTIFLKRGDYADFDTVQPSESGFVLFASYRDSELAPISTPAFCGFVLRTIAGIAIFAMLVVGGKLVAGKEILAHGANDGFGGGGFGHDLSGAKRHW